MGLSNNNSSGRVFLGIKDGKITRRHRDSERVDVYDELEGTLRSMWLKHDGFYGPELHVTLRDAGIDYCLQMKLNSGYARSFMKIAPNFDMELPMKLTPSVRKRDDGNVDYGMFIRQNGQALKWYYTKETPNGLPEMTPCKVKDKNGALVDRWDGSEQLDFLVRAIIEQNKLIPQDAAAYSQENVERFSNGGEGEE
mgnify:CR=1 FL=1